MVETEITAIHNEERHFDVALLRCIVTGKHDKCIRVKLCDIPLEVDGETKVAEIYGQFSREGLQSMLTDLQAAPDPLTLPTPEEIRQGNSYQWVAIYENGEAVQQFEGEGEEVPLALVNFSHVHEFWVSPREPWSNLPMFGLIKGEGFVKQETWGVPHEKLDLPFPEGDYQLNYYRRVNITFTNIVGENEVWPTHVKQIVGWQTGEPDNPSIFEIAIEDDGSWMVYRKERVE